MVQWSLENAEWIDQTFACELQEKVEEGEALTHASWPSPFPPNPWFHINRFNNNAQDYAVNINIWLPDATYLLLWAL